MRNQNIGFVFVLLASSFVVSLGSLNSRAQPPARPDSLPKAVLIERYTRFLANEASMIIDLLRKQVGESPNSKGYIILYCGRICKQGEIEAHINGIVVALKLKNEIGDNFKVLFGGFRKATETEFWFVPERATAPEFTGTESVRDVAFKGKYPRPYVPYECCE